MMSRPTVCATLPSISPCRQLTSVLLHLTVPETQAPPAFVALPQPLIDTATVGGLGAIDTVTSSASLVAGLVPSLRITTQ